VLRGGTFGRLFSRLNTSTGAIEWSRHLGAPWPPYAEHCSILAPDVGVTGTPVYDPSTGTVYIAGYVAGVDTRTRALTLWTDVTGPSYGEAGIWQSGGGLMSDGPGRTFVSTNSSPPRSTDRSTPSRWWPGTRSSWPPRPTGCTG